MAKRQAQPRCVTIKNRSGAPRYVIVLRGKRILGPVADLHEIELFWQGWNHGLREADTAKAATV